MLHKAEGEKKYTIRISVFKPSGKWYTSTEIEVNEEYPVWSDDFKELIKNNLPARIEDGYVVTTNMTESSYVFAEQLYLMNKLIK